jgi:hypothetical protein
VTRWPIVYIGQFFKERSSSKSKYVLIMAKNGFGYNLGDFLTYALIWSPDSKVELNKTEMRQRVTVPATLSGVLPNSTASWLTNSLNRLEYFKRILDAMERCRDMSMG